MLTTRSTRTARTNALLAGVAVAIAGAPTVAAAQASVTAIEEVIVTAQKREERLQDVPLSVTALGNEELASKQIETTTGLVAAVPALSFDQGNNPNNSSFRLRGIGTSNFGQGLEPSVSLVVDGVVAARQSQSLTDFADIDRIEILRGPQGTLFGKNATAGVISIITAAPSKTLQIRAAATIAEGDEYRLKGSISGPLSDTVGVRLSGYVNDVGGHLYNVTKGSDYGGSDSFGVRGRVRWEPSEKLNITGTIDYRDADIHCCQSALISSANPTLLALVAPVVPSADNHDIASDIPPNTKTESQNYSVQANLDIGAATVTAITAFQRFSIFTHQDVDGLNATVPIYPGATGGSAYSVYNVNDGNTEQRNFTQELRIANSGDRRLTYVAGVFYSRLQIDFAFNRRNGYCAAGVLGQPCAANRLTYQSARSSSRLKNNNIAGFGQFEYKLTDNLKALVGARLQYEEVAVAGVRVSPVVPGDNTIAGSLASAGSARQDDTAVTGKAGLQYRFSERSQAYATYTRGYKGAGFDTGIQAEFNALDAIEPEDVDAYEIGYKGDLFDGAVRVAVAAYWANYTNLQVQTGVFDAATGITTTSLTNAGSSRTRGVEFELTTRVYNGFSANASVVYNDTSVNIDGLDCPLQQRTAAPILTENFPDNFCHRTRVRNAAGVLVTSTVPVLNISGKRLPASPLWRYTLTPRYEQSLFGGKVTGFAQANIAFQSSQTHALNRDPLLKQGGRTLVDLSLGLASEDNHYSATFFVKNLFNEHFYTSMSHGVQLASAASPLDIYGYYSKEDRRYVGVNLAFRY